LDIGFGVCRFENDGCNLDVRQKSDYYETAKMARGLAS
jgi:hypothetical protein